MGRGRAADPRASRGGVVTIALFLGFVGITLWITWWAAGQSQGSTAYSSWKLRV